MYVIRCEEEKLPSNPREDDVVTMDTDEADSSGVNNTNTPGEVVCPISASRAELMYP